MSENPLAPPLSTEDKEEGKSHALVVQFRELDKKAESWIQSWNPYHPDLVKNKPLQPVLIEESQIRKTMARFFLFSFGVFMLWAALAPIDAGVSTQGTVMVSGYRKTLQHPTGGIVQEILVKEGQKVNEGDILIRVNPLKAEAELTSAQLQYINVLVVDSRLQAERRGDRKITWSSELDDMGSDPRVKEAKQTQQKLFEIRYNEYVVALNARRTQLASLSDEARNNAELARDGYVSKSQANQIMRSKIETEMALNTLQASYYKDLDTQLADVQKNRDALKARFESVTFDRDLTSIRAPSTGTVVGLKVNTVGGTISGGQVVAELVPKELTLIVDVQIPPNLIDKVRVGAPADMRFVSFNMDTTPVIPGKVKLVSPDRKSSGQPGKDEEFYLSQVEATPEGLALLGSLKVQPGMPVDVIFKTGERTFLSYLFKPLIDKMAKAFKS